MKPVLSLVKDYGGGRIDNFVGDLIASMSGKAMHEISPFLGLGHQAGIDLERGKDASPVLFF